MLNGLLKALLAGMVMAGALWGWILVTAKAGNWLITLGGIAIGVLVYALALILLKVPEFTKAIEFIKRKIFPNSRIGSNP